MHVERVPQGRVERMPGITEKPARLIHAGRRHHEGDPRIGEEEQDGPEHIQHDSERRVNPLQSPFAHPVPGIVIQADRSALGQKDHRVDAHHRLEHPGDIPEERRIEHDQRDRQAHPEQG